MSESPAARHILFVTGEYPPLTGGVGAYTQKLAHALVDLGWQASVLTTAQLAEQTAAAPVRVYPRVERWDWRIWSQAPRLAESIRAGWLHVQYQTAAFGMNPSVNLAVGRWQRSGLRVAWTYHDLLPPYLFPKAGDRLRMNVTLRPARTCDLTVATNEGDRLQLEEHAKNLARIPIGSNIPSAEVTSAQREAIRTRLGYGQDDFVIAYFGFLNRSKGGLTLIRTLEQVRRDLPHARLLMIGERVGASDPTNYAYLQEVETLVDELGLTESVQWTGRLEDEQVSHMLAAADVLFMPYEDGASLRRGTLMAGLAHGCAIVTTIRRRPCPNLSTGRTCCSCRRGPARVGGSHPAHRRRQAARQALRAGAAASSRQFTWQEIARRHAGLYESLAR